MDFTTLGNATSITYEIPYLLVAGLFLVLALTNLRQALIPIGTLMRAAAAVIMVGLAIGAMLLVLVAATVGGY